MVRREGGIWWIRVAAPPAEGKANAALVDYLAEVLGVPKSQVTITRGLKARQKAVAIGGLSEAEAQQRLEAATGGRG